MAQVTEKLTWENINIPNGTPYRCPVCTSPLEVVEAIASEQFLGVVAVIAACPNECHLEKRRGWYMMVGWEDEVFSVSFNKPPDWPIGMVNEKR